MWQRSINNAVTCLVAQADCLAQFTAAYPAWVCVWSKYTDVYTSGGKGNLVVGVCAFVVNMWSKYNMSLEITQAGVVERGSVLCEIWGQEEGSVWISWGTGELFYFMLWPSYKITKRSRWWAAPVCVLKFHFNSTVSINRSLSIHAAA